MSTDPYLTPPEIERHPEARLNWRCAVEWSNCEDGSAQVWAYDSVGHAALYRFVMAWAYVAGDLDE